MLISIYRKYLNYFERWYSHGMAMKTWRHERIILCICDQQVSFGLLICSWFGQILFSSPNKIFPVRCWISLAIFALKKQKTFSSCFYQVIETLVKVWENSKKQWKHSRSCGSCSPTFLVLPNLHSCFCSWKVQTWRGRSICWISNVCVEWNKKTHKTKLKYLLIMC